MTEDNKAASKTKSYTIPSFYNNYRKDIEADTVYDIDYTKYRAIVTDYFQHLRDELLEESKRIKLPYRLGTLLIVKKLPKYWDKRSLRIDYLATKEYNKLIFLTNQHSNYFKYRAHWDKTDVLAKNKLKYLLIMTRANKRCLALYIKQQVHDYEEIR